MIDEEIRRLLLEAEQKNQRLLEQHRDKLDTLAAALLEAETLARDEVERLFRETETKGKSQTGRAARA